jgi:hypothetical protein
MVAAFILSIIYTSVVFLICPNHSTFRSAVSKSNPILLGHYTTIFMGIKTGSNNNINNNNSLLVPGDTDKLGTLISVISVETAQRNNLATRWSNEYPLDLMQSRFVQNYDVTLCFCYGL